MSDDTPLGKFKAFVSEILTVKKSDIDRADAARKAELRAQAPAPEDDEGDDAEE